MPPRVLYEVMHVLMQDYTASHANVHEQETNGLPRLQQLASG